MRMKSKAIALAMVIVMLFTFVGASFEASALTPNSPPYPHVQVVKQMVIHYECSKFGTDRGIWKYKSSTITEGKIDLITYYDGSGYSSSPMTFYSNYYDGFLTISYDQVVIYLYQDYHGNSLFVE